MHQRLAPRAPARPGLGPWAALACLLLAGRRELKTAAQTTPLSTGCEAAATGATITATVALCAGQSAVCVSASDTYCFVCGDNTTLGYWNYVGTATACAALFAAANVGQVYTVRPRCFTLSLS